MARSRPQVKWALPGRTARVLQERCREGETTDVGGRLRRRIQQALKTPRLTGVLHQPDCPHSPDKSSEISIDMQIDEVEAQVVHRGTLRRQLRHDVLPEPALRRAGPAAGVLPLPGVTGQGNWTGYNNQDLDDLIDALRRENSMSRSGKRSSKRRSA